jgi:hypothetical protein
MDGDFVLKSGHWYELKLPMGKVFKAQYVVESSGRVEEWFVFPDQSRKRVPELISYLSSVKEIDPPDEKILRIEQELQEEIEEERTAWEEELEHEEDMADEQLDEEVEQD